MLCHVRPLLAHRPPCSHFEGVGKADKWLEHVLGTRASVWAKKGFFGKCGEAADDCRTSSDPPTETDFKNKSNNVAAKMVTHPDFAGKSPAEQGERCRRPFRPLCRP